MTKEDTDLITPTTPMTEGIPNTDATTDAKFNIERIEKTDVGTIAKDMKIAMIETMIKNQLPPF